jgi:hypothetical protein
MTHDKAIATARGILKRREGYLEAIRFLRRLGLTFRTARQTVKEIQANAPWYRRCK